MTDLGLSRPTPRELPARGAVRTAGDTNVVFIHGILSNSSSAWTAADGTAWPHLLEDEPTRAGLGIFTFAYATTVTTGTYSVEQVVTALHEFLLQEGLLAKPRLMIVAHSMGGIAARRWLVQHAADLASRNIALGLLLVASPSLGSGYANLLKQLNDFLGNSQLAGLELSDRNQWLDGLDRDFRRLLDDGRLTIVGREIVEDRPPAFLAYLTNAPIVASFSAGRYFSDSVTVNGSDHMSVCKPTDRAAIQHTMLLNLLDKLALAGPPARVLADGLRETYEGFRTRGSQFLRALDLACGQLATSLTQPEWLMILRLRDRFEELMAQHLELVAAGKLPEADRVRVDDIGPVRDDLVDLMKRKAGTLSSDLFRNLTRHYLDRPTFGLDPDYDRASLGAGRINGVIDNLESSTYEL